jgi:holliday junction DNA helicase RuvA
MIAQLTGTVACTDANAVILDVHGVGFRVFVPVSALTGLPDSGQPVTLHTVTVVREDDISLYGFRTTDDRALFEILTTVSGVGPKVALSMLSVLEGPDLARVVAANDVKALTKVPGVGAKLAQRIVLEVGERVAEFAFARRVDALAARADSRDASAYEDVVEALVNLGYSRTDSRRAAERVVSAATDRNDAPSLIRDALMLLSGSTARK